MTSVDESWASEASVPEGLIEAIRGRLGPDGSLRGVVDRAFDVYIERGEEAALRVLEPTLGESDVRLLMAVIGSLSRTADEFIGHLEAQDVGDEVIQSVRNVRKYVALESVIRKLFSEFTDYANPITGVHSSPSFAIHARRIEVRMRLLSFDQVLVEVEEPVEEHINTAAFILRAAVSALEEAEKSGLTLDGDRREDAVRYMGRLSELLGRGRDVLDVRKDEREDT